MDKQSQQDFVVSMLNTTREISRNYCLKHFISRLGAIIYSLKKEGYEFTTVTRKNLKPDGTTGKDFIYKVKRFPGEKLPDDTLPLF